MLKIADICLECEIKFLYGIYMVRCDVVMMIMLHWW